jgi:choline dehydrogenase-like flavoprotein
MQGCAYNAKQSQLVTHVPRALELGARLYADTRAEHFRMEGRTAKTLRCAVVDRGTGRPAGLSVNGEAKAFVVAGGGFDTPAFLLRQDVADTLPHLGRHFFCNPCVMTHAVFEEPIIQWRNIPTAWGVEEFRLSRHDRSKGIEVTPLFGEQGAYVEGGYLLMANQLHPGMLAAMLPGLGEDHRRLMRALPRLGGTIAWIDDTEEGRVFVEGGRRRIDVPLTGGNGRRIRDVWRKAARLLVAAGAKELIFGDAADTRVLTADLGADPDARIDAIVDGLDLRPGRNVFAVPHPGGGTRMGKGPEASVVGFDHRVHGTDNIYVADPSVFPTGPSVDPSEAIMAFSYVAAEHVAEAVG